MGDVLAATTDVEAVRRGVQQELDAFLARQAEVLAEVSPAVGPLVEAVGDLVAGGKRLRPAFAAWGYRAGGGRDEQVEIRVGAALELFHAAALLHDDVMDGSDTRRGRPALHRRFEAVHAEAGWDGSSARFGQAAAILAGDLCLGWSDECFHDCGAEAGAVEQARRYYDRMRSQLMAGQYLDVHEQASGSDPEGADVRALQVLRYKSAKYTVEHPLLIGAALAGADAPRRAALSAYGLPLGEAFQLRDDVLGVFGDPGVTGKPAGDDLREGKRTMLVALATQRADAGQAALVSRLLGDPDLDDDGVRALRGVIEGTGALASVETLIDELVDRSRAALADAPLPSRVTAALDELVDVATARAA